MFRRLAGGGEGTQKEEEGPGGGGGGGGLKRPARDCTAASLLASPASRSFEEEKNRYTEALLRLPIEENPKGAAGGGGGFVGKKRNAEKGRVSMDESVPLLDPAMSAKGQGKVRKLSCIGGTINLANTMMGAGMMALPYSYYKLGFVGASASMVVVALCTQFTLDILSRVTMLTDAWTYRDMTEVVMGKAHAIGLQGSIIVNNFGLLTAYMIIIADILVGKGDSGSGVLPQLFHSTSGFFNSRMAVMAVVNVLFIIPLALKRRMESLRIVSTISMMLSMLFISTTCVLALITIFKGNVKPDLRPFPEFTSASDLILTLLSTLPVLLTALLCHYNAHPIYAELEEPTLKSMRFVNTAASFACSGTYIVVGFMGYTLFNNRTQDDVMANFVVESIEEVVGKGAAYVICYGVRIAYAMSLTLSYPLVNFGLRENIMLIFQPKEIGSVKQQKGITLFEIVTVSTILGCYLCLWKIPDIWIAFQLVGGTAAVWLGFVLPALMHLRLYPSSGTRVDATNVGAVALIFFGAVVAAATLYSTAIDIIKGPM